MAITIACGFAEERGEFGQFQKVNSNVNLHERLMALNGHEEIFSLIESSKTVFRLEHALTASKSLVKVLTQNTGRNFDPVTLRQDPRFISLVAMIKEQLSTFGETEIKDFTNFLRVAKRVKMQVYLTQDETNLIKKKITEFVDAKKYSFRELVDMYGNLSYLGMQTDFIAIALFKMAASDPSVHTAFSTSVILRTLSLKSGFNSVRDMALVELVCRSYQGFTTELDYPSKARLLKMMALIEFNYNPPKFSLPQVMNRLRVDLKENAEKLDEADVINVVTAYHHLPRSFPNDLLDEFKSMVTLTLQHNPQNLKAEFLLRFLQEQFNLSNSRRLSSANIHLIIDHLAAKLPNDEYLQLNINKFCRMVHILRVKNANFNKQLRAFLLKNQKIRDNLFYLEFLSKNGEEFPDVVAKVFETTIKNYDFSRLRRLRFVLHRSDATKYKAEISTIESLENFNSTTGLYGLDDSLFLHENQEDTVYVSLSLKV
jgi:hypothetical protein